MISVIMPVYNGGALIGQAIQSVLAQTSPRWEIIAINDGSRDDTQKILEQYAAKESRIHLIRQENAGVSAARNAGMSAAKGEYIAFLDADDQWYPHHLETLEKLILDHPQADLLGTAYDIRFPDGRMGDTAGYFKGKAGVLLLEDFLGAYAADHRAKCFALSSTCVKAEAARRAGWFRAGCRIGEDLGLTLRMALGGPVVLCGRRTILYNKAASTATKVTSFDPDWYFFQEARQLVADPAFSARRRASLGRLMGWFAVRRVRHYLVDGRRRDARAAWQQSRGIPGLGWDRLLTRLLFLMPCGLVRQIFLLRWQKRA